jgi:hypothetical protein
MYIRTNLIIASSGHLIDITVTYNDNTFHEPPLKSFNLLQCCPWQIGPVFTSSHFVTMFFYLGWGFQPYAQPPAILEDRCFLSGLSPLADQPQLKHRGLTLVIGDYQCGYRGDWSTVDQIFTVRQILKKMC